MPNSKPKPKPITKKESRRASRYGTLVLGWQWRTTPTLLAQMESARKQLGLSKTEFMEQAARELIAMTEKAK